MRVFVSYARKDMLLCDAVVRELEMIDNVAVYRDVTHPEPGLSVPDRIKEQIGFCDIFLVLLTQRSVNSNWVLTEIAWAEEKFIVPIVEKEVDLDGIPSLSTDLEQIRYDPADYRPALAKLRSFVEKRIRVESNLSDSSVLGASDDRRERTGLMDRLDSEDIHNLLLLGGADIAPLLEQRLADNAKATVHEFFTDPRYGSFVNVGTLRTDTKVIITRWGTLHALLQAADKGGRVAFRYAGYEAGVLYGLGVIKWFLDKTEAAIKRRGLPRNSIDLLEACLEIDRASGWVDMASGRGNIEVRKFSEPSDGPGWNGEVLVRGHFLTHEFSEVKSKNSERRYNGYESFWESYLESTFSAALTTWYGVWTSEGGELEIPLFVAECKKREGQPGTDLAFDLQIHNPIYRTTYMNLQRELLCPYLNKDFARVVARARGVVEGFVRELADSGESPKEDMTRALTWLGKNIENNGKAAAAALQRVRNDLHSGVHVVDREPTASEARRILRMTAATVIMACRDIRIDDDVVVALRQELLSR